MHLRKIAIDSSVFPAVDRYPFNLPIFRRTESLAFSTPVTLFVGENGSGKSTLLEGITRRCGIHIWGEIERTRFERNPFEEELYRAITVDWTDGSVPGSFFASQTFRNYTRMLDEWASADPEMLSCFGGRSLVSRSHGQSLMAYFKNRYRIRGIYFLDEPETALSPRSQLALLDIIRDMSRAGHAQFIIATHSPILMSCPDAVIYSFDAIPVREVAFEDTDHYRVYRDFIAGRGRSRKA